MNIANHSRHVLKPTECCRRVLVPISRLYLLPLPASPPNHQQIRLFTYPTQGRVHMPTVPSRPLDENITSGLVQLVSESNALLPPEPPSQILRRLDRKHFSLVQVSGPGPSIPICKIMFKREMREYKVQKVPNVRPPRPDKPKELELNWIIGPNDLRRKMDMLKEFLKEGRRVDVRLKRKQKWANPRQEEAKVLEDSVAEVVEEVQATEYKPKKEEKAFPGEKGNVYFFLKGPAKKKEKIKGMDEKEIRKMQREKEMEEKKERRMQRAEERRKLLENTVVCIKVPT